MALFSAACAYHAAGFLLLAVILLLCLLHRIKEISLDAAGGICGGSGRNIASWALRAGTLFVSDHVSCYSIDAVGADCAAV